MGLTGSLTAADGSAFSSRKRPISTCLSCATPVPGSKAVYSSGK